MWPFCKKKTFEEKHAEHVQDNRIENLVKNVAGLKEEIRSIQTLLRKSGIYVYCKTCKFEGNCPLKSGELEPYYPNWAHYLCNADNWEPKER
jgi:hypothetical protein